MSVCLTMTKYFLALKIGREALVFPFLHLFTSARRGAKYQLVKSVRLVGMVLLVITKEEHVPHVTNISSANLGNGKQNTKVLVSGYP